MAESVSSAELHVLLMAVCIVQMIFAMAWIATARYWDGSILAARFMALYCAAGGLSLLLTAQRGSWPDWLTLVGANILSLLGYVGLRYAGCLTFDQPTAQRENVALLVGGVLAFIVLGPDPAHGPWRAALLTGLDGYLLLRVVLSTRRACMAEFGAAPTLTLQVPALILAMMMLLRSVWVVSVPNSHFNLDQVGRDNLILLYVMLVIGVVTNLAAWSVYVMRMVRALRGLARQDALTGLLNRGALGRALQREWLRRERSGIGYAVLMVDVDHFKQVNDNFGHAAGDAVLREVARRLGVGRRPLDRLGRYGGEEFVVLLPGIDDSGAATVAERLREAVAATPVLIEGQAVAVTVSVGVASAASGDTSAEAPVERADMAMYAAKRAGRNRVRVFDTALMKSAA